MIGVGIRALRGFEDKRARVLMDKLASVSGGSILPSKRNPHSLKRDEKERKEGGDKRKGGNGDRGTIPCSILRYMP